MNRHFRVGAASCVVIALGALACSAPDGEVRARTGAAAAANSPPVINAVSASPSSTVTGGTIALSVSASDPDAGDQLTFLWTAPAGSFSTANQRQTNWRAPAQPQTVPITITVRDRSRATATATTSLVVTGQGMARVRGSFNSSPTVGAITASPTRIVSGDTVRLTVIAQDSEADPLSFLWSADCSGTFMDARVRQTTFVVGGLSGRSACTFSVAVTDGNGGANAGAITVAVGPPPPATIGPILIDGYQSSDSAGGGAEISLRIEIAGGGADGGTPTFAWSTSTGSIAAVTSTAPLTVGMALWRAPPCFPLGAGADVSVLVTGAGGGAATFGFSVLAANPTGCPTP